MIMRTRFAPSTTGPAHPGTMLSALLCWLDARSRGAEIWLRLEDLDPDRCRPGFVQRMIDDLGWLGLTWDRVVVQSDRRVDHEAVMDRLEALGCLYPCSCSRRRLRENGRPAPDGGHAYDNRCRTHPLPPGGWRKCADAIRVKLPDEHVHVVDEAGLDLSQRPTHAMGDPVVRRRDGAFAYHLACVVDDHESGMNRIIRGRDLATSAATQILLHRLLGYAEPVYRHHFLLLESHGGKMAKFHGAVGASELRRFYDPEMLCGLLMSWSGVLEKPEPCRPADLSASFDWSRVRNSDLMVSWNGNHLTAGS